MVLYLASLVQNPVGEGETVAMRKEWSFKFVAGNYKIVRYLENHIDLRFPLLKSNNIFDFYFPRVIFASQSVYS